MRLKVEIDELTPEQWRYAQEVLPAESEIPDGVSRACLILMHEGEERHTEVPASRVSSLLMGMNLAPAFRQLSNAVDEAMRHVRTPFQTVAGHTPDTGGEVVARDVQCSPECTAQDDDRPHHLRCPTRKRDA